MAAVKADVEALRLVVEDADAWSALVKSRRAHLAQFLRWAAACEASDRETSLRLENRDDIVRCRRVLPLFGEPWWGVVVYSCFDSETGARVAAAEFRHVMGPQIAERALAGLQFPPRGSVQHHRAQSTLAGARRSLLSACHKAEQIHEVLFQSDTTFDHRFERLMKVNVSWWGRTTCFDVLLRAGALGVSGCVYRPEKAYLLGSQGPAAGFEQIWGISVTKATADLCERLLVRWTAAWGEVTGVAGVVWEGEPYDSGDFENALCVFQEPANRRIPNPAPFASSSQSTTRRRKW